jgi:hypothetical protein
MEQFVHAAAATQHIPWNKGKLVGQKAPSEAEGHLGDSRPSPARKPNPRTCLVQSGDRQRVPQRNTIENSNCWRSLTGQDRGVRRARMHAPRAAIRQLE